MATSKHKHYSCKEGLIMTCPTISRILSECKNISFVGKFWLQIFSVLVPRAPGMHSGGGVAAVQSSCSFICCSGMWTETTRCGEYWKKSNPVVELGGEECYLSKASSLQGLTAEQSRIFSVFAVR